MAGQWLARIPETILLSVKQSRMFTQRVVYISIYSALLLVLVLFAQLHGQGGECPASSPSTSPGFTITNLLTSWHVHAPFSCLKLREMLHSAHL